MFALASGTIFSPDYFVLCTCTVVECFLFLFSTTIDGVDRNCILEVKDCIMCSDAVISSLVPRLLILIMAKSLGVRLVISPSATCIYLQLHPGHLGCTSDRYTHEQRL